MGHNTHVRYINRFTSETKLLVDARLGDDIRAWARQRLGPDPHGSGAFRDQYGVTSVYLDTDAHDVYHRRGSYGRSKYRIRHYESDHAAFLERKLRTRLRLTKRRTRIRSKRCRGCVSMIPIRRILRIGSFAVSHCAGFAPSASFATHAPHAWPKHRRDSYA